MINPIDKTQRERLLGAERKLRDVVELIQRCKACGIDVQEREQVAAYLYDALAKVKGSFVGVQNVPEVPSGESSDEAEQRAKRERGTLERDAQLRGTRKPPKG